MRTARALVLLLPLAISAFNVSRAAVDHRSSAFALQDGDRVVFFGDSITEQRLYTTYVEHYVVSRFPDRKITFLNSGWGGDQTTVNECEACEGVGALPRIDRDVIDKKPTVVTLLFGMNDGKYRDFDAGVFKTYQDGMVAIIDRLKQNTKARLYVMTPTVYDGSRHTSWSHTDKYNDVLDRYSAAAKEIAAREGIPVIDLHAATVDALNRAKAAEADYTFVPDGVHPNEDGQLVMAAEILRAWGAPTGGVHATATVSGGVASPVSLTVEAPLPWPAPMPSARLAAAAPTVAALGSVTASISGLPNGNYSVTVDGAPAGSFSSEALSAGIAIGTLSKQAAKETTDLATLVRLRTDTLFMAWRQLQVPLAGYAHTASAVSAIDDVGADMAERERALARPHSYRVVITRE